MKDEWEYLDAMDCGLDFVADLCSKTGGGWQLISQESVPLFPGSAIIVTQYRFKRRMK
jgi:hypothetical protein